MRWLVVVALLLAVVGTAQGQALWVGASAGTTWEYQAETAPDSTWKHWSDASPRLFLSLPIEDATLVRFQAADMPYGLRLMTGDAECTLRAYTIGVDYLIESPMGEVIFSAGMGGYELTVDKGVAPAGMESMEFGYYVGVGDWYMLNRRLRLTGELTMHRTDNVGTPILVTASIGLAFSF